MIEDDDIHVRIDRATKLRLEAEAYERRVPFSEYIRRILAEHNPAPIVLEPGATWHEPSIENHRERAMVELTRRFRRMNSPDPVRWVRSSIEEMPALRHLDPERVHEELRRRASMEGSP